MGLFTAICIISVTAIISGCLVAVSKARHSSITEDVKGTLSSVAERLSDLERRMSDVETLLIDRDKQSKYDQL